MCCPIYIFLCKWCYSSRLCLPNLWWFWWLQNLALHTITYMLYDQLYWSIPHLFFHNAIALPELKFIFNIPSMQFPVWSNYSSSSEEPFEIFHHLKPSTRLYKHYTVPKLWDLMLKLNVIQLLYVVVNCEQLLRIFLLVYLQYMEMVLYQINFLQFVFKVGQPRVWSKFMWFVEMYEFQSKHLKRFCSMSHLQAPKM